MERKLLELTPKSYLCPICGNWHRWKLSHSLEYYNSNRPAEFTSDTLCPHGCAVEAYKVYVSGDNLYYSTGKLCGRALLNLDGKIPIQSIKESDIRPIVTFDVDFTTKSEVSSYICRGCSFCKDCNLLKLDQGDHRNMKITLGFEFEQADYDKFSKSAILARKERELEERESALKAKELAQRPAEQSAQQEIKKELTPKSAEQPAQQEIKEDTNMPNNIFNMNLEFGPNKDQNIASTLMGVAVKNGDNWRIYDKKKKEITDVGDMQLGNLPIFILPTTKLEEGDLIKDAGEYYFVMKVAKGSTQTLCAKTGEMKTVIPIKNVLGFSCYSKVIALSDSINMDDDFDVEKLAIMSAMCGQSADGSAPNTSMNQLLPLMLFKGDMGGDDDMMKMLLMSSMMGAQAEGSDQNASMNQLLPLMLISKKDTGNDDMTKMLLMSSMMGGNGSSGNNMMMSYLMMDMFMSKKEKKENSPE